MYKEMQTIGLLLCFKVESKDSPNLILQNSKKECVCSGFKAAVLRTKHSPSRAASVRFQPVKRYNSIKSGTV